MHIKPDCKICHCQTSIVLNTIMLLLKSEYICSFLWFQGDGYRHCCVDDRRRPSRSTASNAPQTEERRVKNGVHQCHVTYSILFP